MPNKQDLLHVVRGLLMGGADIIPGVSGGTVALILGIYERLVSAISRFDRELLRLVAARRWQSAAQYVDLRFLTALVSGILLGIVSLASLMHHLLEHHLAPTMAAFFGLILASSLIVGGMVGPKGFRHRLACFAIGFVGIVIAYWIVSQTGGASGSGLGYTFVCGMIGISAMILPGISGAYILLLMGMYSEITGIIKKLPKLEVTGSEFLSLVVFAAGCVVGLLLFSRVLRWLLVRWHSETLSLLCGFMLGSLYRIWPFQTDLTPEISELKHKQFRPFLPDTLDQATITCFAVTAVACVAVLLLSRFAPGPSYDADR